MTADTTTEATPLAGSVWSIRTRERVDKWTDDTGAVAARCQHCDFVIVAADRSATWIHNGTGQVRCGPSPMPRPRP